MGLFDAAREKAAELLSGVGAEVPNVEGATDQLSQSADAVTESAQGMGDTAVDSATGAVEGVTDTVTEGIEPYRP
jgi:hypothetical protein